MKLEDAIIKFVFENNVKSMNTWAVAIYSNARNYCVSDGASSMQCLCNELTRQIDKEWHEASPQSSLTTQQLRQAFESWRLEETSDDTEKYCIGIVQSIVLNTILDDVMINAFQFFGNHKDCFNPEDINILKTSRDLQRALAVFEDYMLQKSPDGYRFFEITNPGAKDPYGTIQATQSLFAGCHEQSESFTNEILLDWVQCGLGYDRFLRALCTAKHGFSDSQPKESLLIQELRCTCETYKKYLEESLTKCLKKEDQCFFKEMFMPKEEDVLVITENATYRERRQVVHGWEYLVELNKEGCADTCSLRGIHANKFLNVKKNDPSFELGLEKYHVVDTLMTYLPQQPNLSEKVDTWVPFFNLLEQHKITLCQHRTNTFSLFKGYPSKGKSFVNNIEAIRDKYWVTIGSSQGEPKAIARTLLTNSA